MSVQQVIRRGSLAIFWLVVGILLLPWGMRGLGYYVDNPGWEVGKAAAERKAPHLCSKIRVFWHIFGPTGPQRRAECIYRYASLTLDPTACELLLPGEYGLACISNLWLQALPDDGCGWNYTDARLFECRHGDGPLRQSDNCKDFSDNPKQFSACISYSAERDKSLEQCKEIPDQFIRSFCETKVGAWLMYPELRNSFYFGTPVPIDAPVDSTSLRQGFDRQASSPQGEATSPKGEEE